MHSAAAHVGTNFVPAPAETLITDRAGCKSKKGVQSTMYQTKKVCPATLFSSSSFFLAKS